MTTHLVLTVAEAQRLSLVRCLCGHSFNHHHRRDANPCKNCPCGAYVLRAQEGRLAEAIAERREGPGTEITLLVSHPLTDLQRLRELPDEVFTREVDKILAVPADDAASSPAPMPTPDYEAENQILKAALREAHKELCEHSCNYHHTTSIAFRTRLLALARGDTAAGEIYVKPVPPVPMTVDEGRRGIDYPCESCCALQSSTLDNGWWRCNACGYPAQ